MLENIEVSSISYELTDEQKQCVETACQGKDLKIKAFAGSGKTSTLVAIAKELSGKGLYLAYNKAIQTDAARKFPLHVDCKTAHSIAYRATAYQIKDRVRTLSIFDITRYVDIKRICCYEENDIAFLVLKLSINTLEEVLSSLDETGLAYSELDDYITDLRLIEQDFICNITPVRDKDWINTGWI